MVLLASHDGTRMSMSVFGNPTEPRCRHHENRHCGDAPHRESLTLLGRRVNLAHRAAWFAIGQEEPDRQIDEGKPEEPILVGFQSVQPGRRASPSDPQSAQSEQDRWRATRNMGEESTPNRTDGCPCRFHNASILHLGGPPWAVSRGTIAARWRDSWPRRSPASAHAPSSRC